MVAEAVVGVDVGATKVLVGYVGRDGRVFFSSRYPMDHSGQAATLGSIRSAVEDFLRRGWDGPEPLAIGVGVVGLADPATGTWRHSMNLEIRTPVLLGAELHELYGLPVAVDNDVHAATLAELRLGTGRGARDFVYLNVGTGLAAGLVCNGELVRGAANYAGELGHTVVEPGGEPCPCGRRGCAEVYASGGGIIAQVRSLLPERPDSTLAELAAAGGLTAGDVFRAADAGDELARAVSDRAVWALGTILTNLVNLLNPEVIVLGGGTFVDGWLAPRLRAHVQANALTRARESLAAIAPSELSVEMVGLLGAATLAWELTEANAR